MVYLGHIGGARAAAKLFEESVDCFLRAFGNGFYGAIVTVAHPTGQVLPGGLVGNKCPKANSLHPAMNGGMDSDRFIFTHMQSPANFCLRIL